MKRTRTGGHPIFAETTSLLTIAYSLQGRTLSHSELEYIYQSSSSIIYEKNLSSSLITKHIYANGMQVGELSGSTSYYLQQGNIGSTRLATTSTGSIQFSTDYLPFGPEYNPSGSGIYYLFTGKLINPLTGLYYFGARYYDPESGRFISEDSNPGNVKDPMSEDRYVYARDYPLSLVDPSGHMFITVALNYQSTLSAKNSYTNSPAYQSWVLAQTTSSQDCGGTGCVAGNYVPVVSSGKYSTAGGGTSISSPTVDQTAYQSSLVTIQILDYTRPADAPYQPAGSDGCTPEGQPCLTHPTAPQGTNAEWEAGLISVGAILAGGGLALGLAPLAAGSVVFAPAAPYIEETGDALIWGGAEGLVYTVENGAGATPEGAEQAIGTGAAVEFFKWLSSF
ncbi:MAG TPA: RHS repeat-associated core domain-containing protein [Nitrososphaerales archaeon]|nr:RHS repeat-associated core domain-containing protein [Nitrososphaerales archaeon]